ncbi:MAG: D-glycerate dehydrogenase [Acidobacteria bacterium]|nr:D-glycerate dehydrogenase [Acidobacteriota bacterium]
MTKPRIFVTRIIPEEGLEMIRREADVEVWQDPLPPSCKMLRQKARGMDALLCLLTDRIDENLIAAIGPQLKVISQMAVGFDNIDVAAATARGIPVGNTPGVLTDTTADLAWALLMAAARRVVEGDKFTRAGKWKTWGPIDFLGPDVTGAALGIIGFGRIGQGLAKRAQGFDMRILYFSRRRHPEAEQKYGAQYADLDTLLREADFVSLHTTLSEETHHLIDDARLKLMKSGAILINTARGPVVDQAALYRALSSRTIAYAALDVTDPEPIKPDDPLLTLDNIIIAPHIGSASYRTRARMATMAAENLIAGLKDVRLPNCVNPQVYDRIPG